MAEAPPVRDVFVGIWDADQMLGTQLSGPLTMTAGAVPRASVAGSEAAGESETGGSIFSFARRGELRTEALVAEHDVPAMWLQPTLTNGTRYATPVDLIPVAPGVWRGRVDPLEDRLTIALHVVRRPDGSLDAFLREPRYNLGIRYRISAVAVSGRTARLTTADGDTIVATLGPSDDTLTLALPQSPLHAPIVFERRSEAGDATPDDGYRVPVATGDGWAIASAASVGLSVAELVELTRFAALDAPTSARSPAIYAIAIERHGTLVYDRYFRGFDEATPHDTRSAGKTYADILAGVAIAHGASFSDETALLAMFGNPSQLGNDDPRKAKITLGNALSMATGLDCDDNDVKSVGNEDNEQNQTRQPDWYRLVLDAPMVRDPGTKAVYCSASINLAGGAIASATHAWLPAYFDRFIARPLQMQRYALNLTPTGQMYLGGGAYVRPRDFLKIGAVFLAGGAWHDRPIVGRDWIRRSWLPRLALGPGDDYGYAWHIRSYTNGGTTYRTYEAQGNGGQILEAIPQLDLALMIVQGNYNNFLTWGKTRDAIVLRAIVAAAGR